MKVAQIIFIVLDSIACIGLVVTVMLQEIKAKGLSVSAGESGSDTFYGKSKGRSKEAVLRMLTSIFAGSFAVITMVLYLLTGRG